MRVLVTGATGFVGRWLISELGAAGHETVGTPGSRDLDIRDADAVSRYVRGVAPDAIVHLAGMAYARDAARDPDLAMDVNVGGTRVVIEAAAAVGKIPILVSGSSEVYGAPDPADIPLREDAPLPATQPYGRSKVAQEQAAIELGATLRVPIVVTRSFNHTGPGQRSEFVAPALARRVLHAKAAGDRDVVVGELDVRRDIGDVRDVARAYRLLLEGLAASRVPDGTVVNVATGHAVSIREVFDAICQLAGSRVVPRVDASLIRPSDPPLIVGDPALLRRLTGWTTRIPLEHTLRDLVASLHVGA